MNEILFEARRLDNGDLIQGYYARKGCDEETYKHFICVPTFDANGSTYNGMFYLTDFEVDPKTVKQLKGYCKHGKWEDFKVDGHIDTYGTPVIHTRHKDCGFVWIFPKIAHSYFKHCPGCGAKMDEEG